MNKDRFKKMRQQMEPGEKAVSDLYKKINEQEDTRQEKRKLNRYLAAAVSVSAAVLLFAGISTSMKIIDERRNTNPYEDVYNSFLEVQEEQKEYDLAYTADKDLLRSAAEDESVENAVPEMAASDSAEQKVKSEALSDSANLETANEFSETNEQVEGVHESDLIKTDGTYIYRLAKEKQTVYIIKAEGGTGTLVHKLLVKKNVTEMYLSQNRLIVLSQKNANPVAYHKLRNEPVAEYRSADAENEESVTAAIYDVTEPEAPELLSEYTQDGNYKTSRMIGENLYLVSEKAIYTLPDNPKEYEKYIPYYIQNKSGKIFIDASQIHVNRSKESMNYLIISGHDIQEKESVKSIQSYTGFSENYYVSLKNFYITFMKPSKTKIISLSLENGMIREKAAGSVKGSVRNQFSMDEYQGHFRIVTTSYGGRIRNNLYILNDRLKNVGSIRNIAIDEEVKSVRYDKERAYLVTFMLTDPLFTIDCSDPSEPKLLGKLKIPGYSTYMHNVDESTILGFGNDAEEDTGIPTGLKLSLFDVSNQNQPKELANFILKNSHNTLLAESYSHKDLLIDTEKKLIGFPVMEDYKTNGYTMFSYENNTFVQLFHINFNQKSDKKKKSSDNTAYPDMISISPVEDIVQNQFIRGVFINDYTYLLDDEQMVVLDKKFKKTETIMFDN